MVVLRISSLARRKICKCPIIHQPTLFSLYFPCKCVKISFTSSLVDRDLNYDKTDTEVSISAKLVLKSKE